MKSSFLLLKSIFNKSSCFTTTTVVRFSTLLLVIQLGIINVSRANDECSGALVLPPGNLRFPVETINPMIESLEQSVYVSDYNEFIEEIAFEANSYILNAIQLVVAGRPSPHPYRYAEYGEYVHQVARDLESLFGLKDNTVFDHIIVSAQEFIEDLKDRDSANSSIGFVGSSLNAKERAVLIDGKRNGSNELEVTPPDIPTKNMLNNREPIGFVNLQPATDKKQKSMGFIGFVENKMKVDILNPETRHYPMGFTEPRSTKQNLLWLESIGFMQEGSRFYKKGVFKKAFLIFNTNSGYFEVRFEEVFIKED